MKIRKTAKRSFMFIAVMMLLASFGVLAPKQASAEATCNLYNATELGRWDLDADGYLEIVYKEDPKLAGWDIVIADFWGGHVGCYKNPVNSDYYLYHLDLDGFGGEELFIVPKLNLYTGPSLYVYTQRNLEWATLNLGPIDYLFVDHNTDGIPGNEIVTYRKPSSYNGFWQNDGTVRIYDHRDHITRNTTVPSGCKGYQTTNCYENTNEFSFLNLDGVLGDEIRVTQTSTYHTLITQDPPVNHTVTITDRLNNFPTLVTIDSPTASQTIRGIFNVGGWALDESGVTKIEILVDGVLKGTATLGIQREDVYNAYPKYRNHNAGFNYSLNTAALTVGAHTLTVRETGNLGLKKSVSRTIYVAR